MRIGLVTLGLAMAVTAMSDNASDVKAIEAGYRKLERNIIAKNANALVKMVTDDFTWTDPSGKVMDRKAFAAMSKSQMTAPGLKFLMVEMKNDSYGFMGDECSVRNITTVKLRMKMEGKTMTMTGVSEGVDTWRRTPSGWRPCKVQIVRETQTMG